MLSLQLPSPLASGIPTETRNAQLHWSPPNPPNPAAARGPFSRSNPTVPLRSSLTHAELEAEQKEAAWKVRLSQLNVGRPSESLGSGGIKKTTPLRMSTWKRKTPIFSLKVK